MFLILVSVACIGVFTYQMSQIPPPPPQVDGTPHRVQVADILDDMVSAFFVDIGDTELVAARSLSPLDGARFGQLPGQALHASLSGVDGDRPGATEELSRLVLRKSLICQVSGGRGGDRGYLWVELGWTIG